MLLLLRFARVRARLSRTGPCGDLVQTPCSGERPEMAAHLWSTGYSVRSSLKPVSTASWRGWKGGGGGGLAGHAVGS